MHAVTQAVIGQYQVRKTRRQKAAFRAFLRDALAGEGIASTEEVSPVIKSANVVVGDVNKADYVFTAHYDTCAELPLPNLIAPKNLFVSLLYQLLLGAFLVVAGMGAGALMGLLFRNPWISMAVSELAFLGILALLLFGPANRRTMNDNTSGVAVLLEAMLSMSPDARKRAAFVFFDNEELGMLGSSFFKKQHTRAMADKPLINFDCVSDGDHVLFVTSRAFRQDAMLVRRVEGALSLPDGKTVELCPASRAFYPSDQMHFKVSAGVAALRRAPGIGLYLGRIHTRRDTRFDERNIAALASFAQAMCDDGRAK